MSKSLYEVETPTPKKSKKTDAEPQKELFSFSVVSALAIYKKDDATKQRHVNVMLETVNMNITRADLDKINRGVMARIHAENGVNPEDLLDIVILNITRLAVSTREEFYGPSEEAAA